ncbi:MAG: hypothetical protein JWR15_2120, partial [Prosthecobacter sp.]|nr:hypothetical protein [Prosthecobacter sp.]
RGHIDLTIGDLLMVLSVAHFEISCLAQNLGQKAGAPRVSVNDDEHRSFEVPRKLREKLSKGLNAPG